MTKPEIRRLSHGCQIERSSIEPGARKHEESYDYCVRKLTKTGAVITWVESWVGEAVWDAVADSDTDGPL